uniref:Uncharacterized protein n=1 Tax=Oryza rufipogon TaxID=4529 RepID=A0A0E0R3C9_ORYRU
MRHNSLRPKPGIGRARRKCRRREAAPEHGAATTCTAAWTRAPRQEQAAEIPIVLFLSMVFPGTTVQLQVFEFRYRIMRN